MRKKCRNLRKKCGNFGFQSKKNIRLYFTSDILCKIQSLFFRTKRQFSFKAFSAVSEYVCIRHRRRKNVLRSRPRQIPPRSQQYLKCILFLCENGHAKVFHPISIAVKPFSRKAFRQHVQHMLSYLSFPPRAT